jgi:hypothetical protein
VLGARAVSQGEQWQRGVSNIQAELHERIPLMEYDCATLVQEVRRAQLQVETDRELAKLYPPHMAHEKQQMLSYGRYVLQGLKSELEAMTAERAHVSGHRLPPLSLESSSHVTPDRLAACRLVSRRTRA